MQKSITYEEIGEQTNERKFTFKLLIKKEA